MEQARSLVISMAIDPLADVALQERALAEAEETSETSCDACGEHIEGEPAGRGLYMWTRGDEVRYEEPPLCMNCATAIGITALAIWNVEEEEG
jgi:hypothetical protein